MISRTWWAVGGCVLLASTSVALWQISTSLAAVPEPVQRQPAKTSPETEKLGGADRFLTYVSTDKPLYKPGETMYVRAAVLHYLTNKPAADNMLGQPVIEVI